MKQFVEPFVEYYILIHQAFLVQIEENMELILKKQKKNTYILFSGPNWAKCEI